MSDIEKQANDLFKQLEEAAKDLGEEAGQHYNSMVSAYHELDMLIWYASLNKAAPEPRLFKIVILPEEEAQQTFDFTGSLSELGEELFKIISGLSSELIPRPKPPTHLRHGIQQTVSMLYEARNDVVVVEVVTCSPIKYVITLYPVLAEV